jgi:hypothetical protein
MSEQTPEFEDNDFEAAAAEYRAQHPVAPDEEEGTIGVEDVDLPEENQSTGSEEEAE